MSHGVCRDVELFIFIQSVLLSPSQLRLVTPWNSLVKSKSPFVFMMSCFSCDVTPGSRLACQEQLWNSTRESSLSSRRSLISLPSSGEGTSPSAHTHTHTITN